MKDEDKQIDLHPSDYKPDWQPPIGNQLYNNEKPHIWQEFKRDLHMTRKPGQPIIGRGWPILVFILLAIAGQTYFAINGSPAWLLALRNLF